MKIRPEAWRWVLGSGLPALVLYGLWIAYGYLWAVIGFAVCSSFCLFFLYFFRDPDRHIKDTDHSEEPLWVSPADGIVTSVDNEGERSRIVIFLTVFNVHVNRMPIAGSVKQVEYTSGQFLPAYAGDLETKNERNRVICEDQNSRSFEVWQIAGLLARRIHFWLSDDDTFKQGERFGMISLGSRTDLVLPKGVEPNVDEKDVVRGGETVVARG